MIEAAPFLRKRFQRVLPQYQRFLDSSGVSSSLYSVAPEAGPATTLVAVYSAEDFGADSYATLVRIVTSAHEASFTTGLDSALYFTAALFKDPATLDRLRSTDPAASDDAIVAVFGIDQAVLKPKVAGWSTGVFIAPDGQGYACFSVDTHGEIAIEARSANFAGIACYYATWKRAETSNLSADIAKFAETG